MYFSDSRKESFSSWSCHPKKLSVHRSVTLTREFVPYWLNLAGGTMKRQCVHFQRLHIFSSQTSKLIGKYSKNCNCFHWWPSHWVQTRPARMTLEGLLQSSLWITGVKKKKKKSPLVPDIYPLPFMSCILALVGCTQSNEGSPSGMWVHLQAWDCLCMISRQYVAICKNPGPIIHLVQTWILRVPGSPSTDSSVEVHEERRALQIFHT